jgi:hypothetical protein
MGFNAYASLGRAAGEELVPDRLMKNRVWAELNDLEKNSQ